MQVPDLAVLPPVLPQRSRCARRSTPSLCWRDLSGCRGDAAV